MDPHQSRPIYGCIGQDKLDGQARMSTFTTWGDPRVAPLPQGPGRRSPCHRRWSEGAGCFPEAEGFGSSSCGAYTQESIAPLWREGENGGRASPYHVRRCPCRGPFHGPCHGHRDRRDGSCHGRGGRDGRRVPCGHRRGRRDGGPCILQGWMHEDGRSLNSQHGCGDH